MKKINLFIYFSFCIYLFFSILQVNANTTLNYSATTSASYSDECPSEAGTDTGAGPRTMYGIPQSTGAGSRTTGSSTCLTHYYYASANYPKPITATSGVTNCGPGERVVSWNGSTSITCSKYDDTRPVATDITTSEPNNLLALHNYSYDLNLDPGSGSPISLVTGYSENKDDQNIDYYFSDSRSPWSVTWNISKVDNFRNIDSNAGRRYTFRINKVCDESGNCWNGTKDFTHNVYANTNLITTKSYTEELSNSANIADGSEKYLSINLADTYLNKIVPAFGIGRTIDFNFSYDNDLYLNQFTRTGNSAVYTDWCGTSNIFTSNIFPIGTSKSCDNNAGSNGTYTYGFKVYTPTANTYLKASGNFAINNITFDVNGTGRVLRQSLNSWSSIASKYNPLYYTNFGGSQVSGFIEGVVQNGALSITKDFASSENPTASTYLKFGGNTGDYDMYYSKTGNPITDIKESGILTDLTYYGPDTGPLKTKLVQTGSTTRSTGNILLSSHIKYDLDGLTPIYNSDIIGKDNYWGTYLVSQQANQSQLKVYGLVGTTSSTKLNSFTSNQAGNAIEISGGFDKAALKTSLISQTTRIINSNLGNTQNNNSALPSLSSSIIPTPTGAEYKVLGDKKNIVLYKGNKLVSLNNGLDYDNTNLSISGKKTIIIYGGDLYINKNMYYNDNNSILGIIVMKDATGKGGNIYINPNVTNVVGTIYASRSLFSASISSPNSYYDYTDMTYYDGNADADILKNQLYIYGSLFSANTLGGSKSTPKKCPYYVTNCTRDEAIKYDLNFLRRYYLVDKGTYKCPANGGKVSGGGQNIPCSSRVLTGGNPLLYKNITSTSTDADSAYPLIIKYNSNLQTNPPPLFSQN